MIWDFSENKKCKISMLAYTLDLLQEYGVTGKADSPAAEHLFQTRLDTQKLDTHTKELFHSGVMKCSYIGKRTRPDILLPVSFLATRIQEPDVDDWKKFQRVLRYLNSTPELGIALECGDKIKIESYIDASYAVHTDYRSHTGMVITLGSGPIDVSSTKQKINTKSSAEAELIGLSDKTSQAIWCRSFLMEQGYQVAPATIHQDNQSTIALAKNGLTSSDRTRHVSIRYFWMKDKIESKEIEVIYKPTT
jgi:hypothetical protein